MSNQISPIRRTRGDIAFFLGFLLATVIDCIIVQIAADSVR